MTEPGPADLPSVARPAPPSAPLPPPSRAPPRARGSTLGRWLRRLGRIVLVLAGAIVAAMLVLRFVNPPFTPVMLASRLSGGTIEHRWVPLDAISPDVVRAVVTSEDGRFCRHHGVDFIELASAIQAARRGNPRGASTITMQVVKNLFLWPQRSYVRKFIEIPLALVLDALWPKRRVLEVYLNIAEWGPGVYGVEAAAQQAFGRPAAELSADEAARLAVSLPNPAERDAGEPDETVERLAERLMRRMGQAVALSCLN